MVERKLMNQKYILEQLDDAQSAIIRRENGVAVNIIQALSRELRLELHQTKKVMVYDQDSI